LAEVERIVIAMQPATVMPAEASGQGCLTSWADSEKRLLKFQPTLVQETSESSSLKRLSCSSPELWASLGFQVIQTSVLQPALAEATALEFLEGQIPF
jgi:hypothetical protein